MFDTAAAGINTASVSFALLVTSILRLSLLIAALIIASMQGGQGIQKPVRQAFMTLGVCALLVKGYIALTDGALGLF
jgi:hypothetical protein